MTCMTHTAGKRCEALLQELPSLLNITMNLPYSIRVGQYLNIDLCLLRAEPLPKQKNIS